jgi:hypothetical protein
MIVPALGAAVRILPAVSSGGGSGESDRKSGWMCDSGPAGLGERIVEWLIDVAGEWLRERERRFPYSAGGARSNGCPGLGLLVLAVGEPGIVSRTRDCSCVVKEREWMGLEAEGEVEMAVCQAGSTEEVSQESKESGSVSSRSPVPESREGGRWAVIWRLESGRTAMEREERREDMVSEPERLRVEATCREGLDGEEIDGFGIMGFSEAAG